MPYSLGSFTSGSPSAENSQGGRNGVSGKVAERIKPLAYSATVNKLLLDVEADTTEGSVKTGAVGEI